MKFKPSSLNSQEISEHVVRRRLCGENLEFILYTYQPGAVFAVHQHPAEQLTIVIQGELIFTFDDEEVVLVTGDAILIPPERRHGAYVPTTAGETRTYNIFSPVRERLPGA
ncbi:MAG: cupin domain-containing protein [Trueperaceae bacterium]|nr:MAG: cupin domain-containing protein [Trueperaceae bacterium]